MDMATDMDTTTERGLLMPSPLMPLPQAPTLMLRLTPGTDTTGTGTGLTAMGTMATDLMVMLTGDKKWTSRTTSDLFLPTHLQNASFCKTIFFLVCVKNSFVLCIRVP